jgi:hypothetical protein
MVITPMLLRDWLRAGHLKDEYLKAAGSVFKEEIRRTGIDETNGTAMDQAAVEEIIHCYALLANGALVLMSSFIPLDKRGSFHSIVLEAIRAFQRLCQAAVEAFEFKPRKGNSRQGTPQAQRGASATPGLQQLGALQAPAASRAPSPSSVASEDIPDVDRQVAPPARKPKAAGDFKRWQALPNTHQGVHWHQVADRFSTPMNVHVLSGENKHR